MQVLQLHPRDSMAKVKLGSEEFDVDSEDIDARECGVTAADCVALAAYMKSGEMRRLKKVKLVRLLFFCVAEFPPSPPLIRIISQSFNNIGDEGMCAIADAIRTKSSVQTLGLVRMCCG
jgi:hypothetical protein